MSETIEYEFNVECGENEFKLLAKQLGEQLDSLREELNEAHKDLEKDGDDWREMRDKWLEERSKNKDLEIALENEKSQNKWYKTVLDALKCEENEKLKEENEKLKMALKQLDSSLMTLLDNVDEQRTNYISDLNEISNEVNRKCTEIKNKQRFGRNEQIDRYVDKDIKRVLGYELWNSIYN
jgi:uncharacterized phage infection (PIP) family protein YhgE